MNCSNPECGRAAGDIRVGIVRLLEMEAVPDERVTGSDTGFPVCSVQSRYFWLCEECSKALSIKKWTAAGIVLGPRNAGIPLPASRPVKSVFANDVIQRSRLPQSA